MSRCRYALILFLSGSASVLTTGAEPPVINPFGPRTTQRGDAIPGYVELSNGNVIPGAVYMTRDLRLKIYDQALKRQREVPLNRVKQINCTVEREWMEREWRFRENANDRKVYTGRQYPARIYVHVITLTDGREIRGPLSGIVYVRQPNKPPRRFLLYKRQKGTTNDKLKDVVYVRRIRLGPEALAEGKKRALEQVGERGER